MVLSDSDLLKYYFHDGCIKRGSAQYMSTKIKLCIWSSGYNYKGLNIFSVDLKLKNIVILWVVKNSDHRKKLRIKNKKVFRSFNAKHLLFKKTVGKKFVNYLGPKYYNSILLAIHINQNIINNCKYNDDKKKYCWMVIYIFKYNLI